MFFMLTWHIPGWNILIPFTYTPAKFHLVSLSSFLCPLESFRFLGREAWECSPGCFLLESPENLGLIKPESSGSTQQLRSHKLWPNAAQRGSRIQSCGLCSWWWENYSPHQADPPYPARAYKIKYRCVGQVNPAGPVDISRRQFRKQCKGKERKSKSRDSEEINQKEEFRKRKRN